ncbi:DivIVA domain-containing protein [Actinophytocola oryzae]|uniref:Cell wall synthesis protein Wag31 n=1 Tax=Actinophytocola oryzae TaxID=502181 RepID=A0A4R7V935_9PSEU|nr:DivIVA domain-containing protein [Actinophytocola oryzae]TDV45433.1 DivIVA domain-containing protein [Actinophytocola oryzae]
MDVVPLTPVVVDCVTFDRAPLGRRGYNEDQVDDFLDRVQATLEGRDSLTAQTVRDVTFDPAPFIRRGYHEEQVDEFLDLVVEELSRREGTLRIPAHLRPTPPPTAAEQTTPMRLAQPPSVSSARSRRHEAASGPPRSTLPAATDSSGAVGNGVRGTSAQGVSAIKPVDAAPPVESVVSRPAPVDRTARSESDPVAAGDKPTTSEAPVSRPDEPPAVGDDGPQALERHSPPAVEAGTDRQPTGLATVLAPIDQPGAVDARGPASTESVPAAPAESGALPTSIDRPDADPQSTPPADQPPSVAPAAAEPTSEVGGKSVASHTPEDLPAGTPPQPPSAEPAATPAASASADRPEADGHETPPRSSAAVAPSGALETDAWRDSDHLVLPVPPAPPGERGYRPGDVERLMRLLAAALDDPGSPDPDKLAALKLGRTFFVGQGYHVEAVDAVRQAWLDELGRRAL